MSKDRAIEANAVKSLLTKSLELGLESSIFRAGEVILEQGGDNKTLYVVLEGHAELVKEVNGISITVDRVSAGNFLGLLSFWSGEPSFSGSVAVTDVTCVSMSRVKFKRLMDEDKEFNRTIQDLIISNLTQRYKRMAVLNVEVARLSKQLEEERNSLKETVRDLELTRGRLVHQGKLATMGQLLAGIAHEINNPSSALLKSVELLENELPKWFSREGALASLKTEGQLMNAGLKSSYVNSVDLRNRMGDLAQNYPKLKRSITRRLAQLSDRDFGLIEKETKTANKKADSNQLDQLIGFFEVGVYLRSIHASVNRITTLVKSLKNYGRLDASERVVINLKDCVVDTLVVLNNRLKNYDFVLEWTDIPDIECHPGEINQVLTNLIVNACDATEVGRRITLDNGEDGDFVWIRVQDDGSGIPGKLLNKIFDANVTTKHKSGEFGLGLGLSISREIMLKHDGKISAKNRENGRGAEFTFWLPCSIDN